MKIHKGTLGWELATGCKGIVWVMEVKDKTVGRNGTIHFWPGDRLRVFNERGELVFNQYIDLDMRTCYDPLDCFQKVRGMRVYWVQAGWPPEQWMNMFFRRKGSPPLRAELVTNR